MTGWPDLLLTGSPRDWSINKLHNHFVRFRADFAGETQANYPGQRWLLGYVLPPFQRPLVWDEERMIRFVESAVLGLHLGTFVYNKADNHPMVKEGDHRYLHITDQWLIDGQQRLSALENFFSDRFPVFGKLWSQTSQDDRYRLLRQPFAAFETEIIDEAQIRTLYDRLNFGGVAHTPDQRANPSDADAFPTSEEPSYPTP